MNTLKYEHAKANVKQKKLTIATAWQNFNIKYGNLANWLNAIKKF